MSATLSATVIVDQIDVRFPFSGLISQVFKKVGDSVAIGQSLASLDPKTLQTELDKELADYEKIRARFEIFNRDHPTLADDTTKFLKTIEQADLNSSVKSVELAKARLDQISLKSPVNGLVISDGGCRRGLYASPASNAFTLLDLDSLRLRAELEIDQLSQFNQSSFSVEVLGETISLTSTPILPLGKKYFLDFYFPKPVKLPLGTILTIKTS